MARDDQDQTRPQFRGGANIAMKLPRARFEETVAFYRDVLGLPVTEQAGPEIGGTVVRSVTVPFGPVTLWLDQVDTCSQAEVWLEVVTTDVGRAMEHLAAHGVRAQDELEPLPDAMDAHWVSNPGGIPHLVVGVDDA